MGYGLVLVSGLCLEFLLLGLPLAF
jgi:hypothetical protein